VAFTAGARTNSYKLANHLDLSLLKAVSGKPPRNRRAAILPSDTGFIEQFPKNVKEEHLTEAIKNLRPDRLSIVDGVGMFTALDIDRIKKNETPVHTNDPMAQYLVERRRQTNSRRKWRSSKEV
jgi:hypothetical protein